MIKNRPFKPGDFTSIIPKEVYKDDVDALKRCEDTATTGLTFAQTFTIDEKPVGIIGVTVLRAHIAELWGFLSEDVKKYPLAFHKQCIELLNKYFAELNVPRFQCYVMSEYLEGNRWMKLMGFQREGLLRKFGADGKDYFVWSKVV